MQSDFLYTSGNLPQSQIRQLVRRTFGAGAAEPPVFTGQWGVVAAANRPFGGFEPLETDTHICVVLAAPLWRSGSQSTATRTPAGNAERTREILDRYTSGASIDWSDDLVGQFAVFILDKGEGSAVAITDTAGFAPLYYATSKSTTGVTVIGSHVDLVAAASNRTEDLDAVSVADFLTHGVATHPYTRYEGVRQLPAATVSTFRPNEPEPRNESYWQPLEHMQFRSLSEAAEVLRVTLQRNVERMATVSDEVGYFLSGGEDSRLVGTLLRDRHPRFACTIATEGTQELGIAQRVAIEHGIPHRVAHQSSIDGLSMLPFVLALTSSHNHYTHASAPYHADELRLHEVGTVFGGFMADTFCKGDHINKTKLSYATVRLHHNEHRYYRHAPETIWKPQILEELHWRHEQHITFLRGIRPSSWAEWFSLWPSANNICNGALIANRRSITTSEPFCDSAILRLCAGVPQHWTVNRRLFHAAFKAELQRTKSVPHCTGFYPHRSSLENAVRTIPKAMLRRIVSRRHSHVDPWQSALDAADSRGLLAAASRALGEHPELVPARAPALLMNDKTLHAWLKLGVLQLLYQHTDTGGIRIPERMQPSTHGTRQGTGQN